MQKPERINGFDALRTVAMWLGIVLHSIIAYKIITIEGWPSDNQFQLKIFDWLYDFIHIFRMPLFFLVAGFFTRLVLHRSGIKYFLQQRFKRILIPFGFGVVLIVPLTLLPFNFYRFAFLQNLPFSQAWELSFVKMIQWGGLAHLWFLYYLLIFYIITATFYFIYISSFNGMIKSFSSKLSYRNTLFYSLISIILLYIVMLSFDAVIPPVYTGVKPKLFHLVYYGLFFLMGFIFQTQYQIIKSFAHTWMFFLSIGIGLSIYLFYFHLKSLQFVAFLTSIETISLVYGCIGFFVKYCHEENATWRYLSDSAYWVYLVHMGIVAFLQVGLLNSTVFPFLRPVIVLLVTMVVSLASYHWFVRFSVIGEFLHGKRTKFQLVIK